MITISSTRISLLSRDNAEDSSAALLAEELEHLDRLAADEAQKINELFDQIVAEVTILDSYAEQLFNDGLNITPYQSYWWDSSLEFTKTGRSIPGIYYDSDYDSYISYDCSCYYMPRDKIDNLPGDDPFNWTPELEYLLNTSSNLDIAFKNLHEANENYVWIYASFADPTYSLFRNYPYDTMIWTQEDEDGNPVLPADDWDPLDLDPDADWYQNAASITGDGTAFTAPYYDDIGLIISVGRPVRNSTNDLIGVVSVDITIQTMKQSILSLSFANGKGYAFLIDINGDTITHPLLEEEFVDIVDLEMENATDDEIFDFNTLITEMRTASNGQSSYMKDGEKWYVSFNPIDAPDYSLALVVPEDAILEPVEELRADILRRSTNNILISVGLLVLALILIIFISVTVSRRTVQPIRDFIEFSERIAKGDLSRDLDTDEAIPREIQGLHEALDGLLTALRFGNSDYYGGNLDLAYNNYLKALKLFETTNDQAGIGVCLNNIGNVYREWGELDEATDFYRKAIAVAENLKDEAGMASRYNNYGLSLLDKGEVEEAQKYVERALELYEKLGIIRGRVLSLNNLGLIHFKKGDVKLAFGYYEDALKLAKEDDFLRGAAHSLLNLAVFYLEQYDVLSAKDYFKQALEAARMVNDVLLEEEVLERYQMVEKELGDSASQDEIKAMLQRIRGGVAPQKTVQYVLDYSGSMSGSRARAAIKGSIDLFNTALKDKDVVGIITFFTRSHQILPFTPIRNNKTRIIDMFKQLTRPNGNTAMWDAIANAIENLENVGGTQRWLVLLTDGEDNSSTRSSADIKRLIKRLKFQLNLVIISVGDIGSDEAVLMDFCTQVNGTFIKITDTRNVHKEIEKAFKTVGQLMSQAQVSVEGLVLDDL